MNGPLLQAIAAPAFDRLKEVLNRLGAAPPQVLLLEGGSEAQRRYDIAYQQCMYAKGNQLPGSAYRYRATPLPPQAYPYPPPPPPPPPR